MASTKEVRIGHNYIPVILSFVSFFFFDMVLVLLIAHCVRNDYSKKKTKKTKIKIIMCYCLFTKYYEL